MSESNQKAAAEKKKNQNKIDEWLLAPVGYPIRVIPFLLGPKMQRITAIAVLVLANRGSLTYLGHSNASTDLVELDACVALQAFYHYIFGMSVGLNESDYLLFRLNTELDLVRTKINNPSKLTLPNISLLRDNKPKLILPA